ncbi:unnamed protein product [marine sediment metagenome]|uniref:Uncharacterized protein n=1 Tax=marine sediment metagenome TaxID=412755 RepID=X1SV84_9ZZZZ
MTQQSAVSPFINMLGVGASVPLGASAIVTVWGRNDMSTQQQLGMRWEIRDPDGLLIEQYPGGGAIDWEYGYTGPGDEQDFIGGRFDINKSGDWTIAVELVMNPDNPFVVDTYDGLLCRVTEEFAGTITRKELKYDNVVGPIPVY